MNAARSKRTRQLWLTRWPGSDRATGGGCVHARLLKNSGTSGRGKRAGNLVRADCVHVRGAAGFYVDHVAEPGPDMERAARSADGFAVQGENGFGRDGRFVAAGCVFVFFQLRALESNAQLVVPAATGNSERRKPGTAERLWRF